MSRIACFLVLLIGTVVGTGAYVLLPAVMYALLGTALLAYAYLLVHKVVKVDLQSNLILLLYLVFLLFNFIRDADNAVASRLYLNFIVGISAYLVVIKVFDIVPDNRWLRYLPLLSLLVIAAGIALELNGVIVSRRDGEAMEGVDEGLLLRPGGYLNPNRTATLSLVWLFCALEANASKSVLLKSACFALCVFVLTMTQSRAAMLFLAIYFLYKLVTDFPRSMKYVGIPALCGAVLFAFTSQSVASGDIYAAILQRFHGDGSSDERYHVFLTALANFSESPLVGHGMRSMVRMVGIGTHDEPVEWLVNFGVVGFLIMLVILVRFYFIKSFAYICLCILPTFLFSHNFFEATAFQTALGCAYAFAIRSTRTLGSMSEQAAVARTQRAKPQGRNIALSPLITREIPGKILGLR